jgi:hypothetical protein
MRSAQLATLTLTLAAAGCGGGGAAAPSVPAPMSTPASAATMSLAISIPFRTATSSSARTPRYVSDGTQALAVYDGATLLYVGNLLLGTSPAFVTPPVYSKSGATTVTTGDCVRGSLASTCTLTVTTVPGPHTFGLTAYAQFQGGFRPPGSVQRAVSDIGTPPTFTGLILSEGELSMTAVGGNNPQQLITLLGVADIVQWFGVQPPVGFNQTATLFYAIQDARSGQIVTPGNAYDNGPVTITASPAPLVSMTPVSQSVPPSTNGSQSFSFKCISGSGGTVTFTASAGKQPNATYASALTYTPSNYSSGTLSSIAVQCNGS